jgi:hypothetical protein
MDRRQFEVEERQKFLIFRPRKDHVILSSCKVTS